MARSDSFRKTNRRQMQNRKQKQFRSACLLLMLKIVALVMLIVYIKDLYAKMQEMQMALNRMEVLQYGTVQAMAKVQDDGDYVSTISIIDIEKPQNRTSEEIMLRLNELGKSDPVIKQIQDNSSLYPENMLAALANNPEMADFVSGYLSADHSMQSGLTKSEIEQEFPLFLQWDPRWGYQEYGNNSNMGISGCGPTCLSMVLYYLTGNELLTPDRIGEYSMEHGYYVDEIGTSWMLMEDMPALYEIEVAKPRLTDRAIKAELDKGRIIICAMGEGDFTISGHFIVIYGYSEQGYRINDPNCVARSRRIWPFDEIKGQIKSIWSYASLNQMKEEEK